MSAEAFSRAIECFETLPGAGNLQRSMTILAQAGVGLPHIRAWAVSIAREYGVWPYVASDFARLLGIAAAAIVNQGQPQ
jgi:hypothetical protein